jgi:hypothetical protein
MVTGFEMDNQYIQKELVSAINRLAAAVGRGEEEIKVCSMCGSDKTYIQSTYERWHYDKQGNLLCDKCYFKVWYEENKEHHKRVVKKYQSKPIRKEYEAKYRERHNELRRRRRQERKLPRKKPWFVL